MTNQDDVLSAVGITSTARSSTTLSSGVTRLDLTDGRSVVAKIGPAAVIGAEADGLAAIEEIGAIPTPRVWGVVGDDDRATLVTDWVGGGVAGESQWRAFGRTLGAHHRASSFRQYGWHQNNFIGASNQSNQWCDGWVSFHRDHRLGPQLEAARSRNLLTVPQASIIERLIECLEVILPDDPGHAVLHGDLWSGNVSADGDGVLHVIDPAVSVGDGWADIAMLRLFGGVPTVVESAYAEAIGMSPPEPAIGAYQCYHLLNHVNLFGRGYASSAAAVAARAISAV